MQERLSLVASLLVLAAAVFLAFEGIEPVASWLFPVASWSFIVFIDGLVVRRKGESLLTTGGWQLPLLLFSSVVFWSVFELLNLRLDNWYYVNFPRVAPLRILGELISFSTVIPVILEVADLLEAYGFFATMPPPEIRISSRAESSLLGAGLLALLLALALPRLAYPLVWLVPFLLCEPWLHRKRASSLLGDYANGQTRRFKLLLSSGILCGLGWEALNAQARAGWYYVLPGFDIPYYFRLPAFGLVGFLPMALSAYSFYLMADTLLGGRGWRLAEWPEEGRVRLSQPRSGGVVIPGTLGLFLALGGLIAVEEGTVESIRPQISDLELSEEHATLLDVYRLGDPFKLADDAHGWRGAALAMDRGVPLGQISSVVEHATLTTIGGMGTANAEVMMAGGVTTVERLARSTPEALRERLLYVVESEGLDAEVPSAGTIHNFVRAARAHLRQ